MSVKALGAMHTVPTSSGGHFLRFTIRLILQQPLSFPDDLSHLTTLPFCGGCLTVVSPSLSLCRLSGGTV